MKSYKDIACHNCGAVLPMEISNMPTEEKKIWYPGKKCPICGSQEFFPSIKSSGPVEKEPVKGWRYNSWYGISAMAVVVILIPVYFLLRRPATIAARTTVVSCTECDAASEAQVRKKPPYACPVCKKRSAYVALYCQDDSTIYPWKVEEGMETAYPPCPECQKINPGLISDETQLKEIRNKRKHYEQWKKYIEEQQNAAQ